jgi:hypothetical protein
MINKGGILVSSLETEYKVEYGSLDVRIGGGEDLV